MIRGIGDVVRIVAGRSMWLEEPSLALVGAEDSLGQLSLWCGLWLTCPESVALGASLSLFFFFF